MRHDVYTRTYPALARALARYEAGMHPGTAPHARRLRRERTLQRLRAKRERDRLGRFI